MSGNPNCQTAAAQRQQPVLDWPTLDALISRMQRRALELMLPDQSILSDANYLVVAGRNVWDLWHEAGLLPFEAFVSGHYNLLNVEFRRTRYVDVGTAYTIRVQNALDWFIDPFPVGTEKEGVWKRRP